MSSKKKTEATANTKPPTLKIGSRVRCTDDRVEGRIVWANAVSVKIRWDDGEQVTWRRDSLADRPSEILEPASDEDQKAIQTASEQTAPSEQHENETQLESASESASTSAEQSAAESMVTPETTTLPSPLPKERRP